MPAISLYVPAYNAAATLGPCLQAILAQTRPAEEVLVVDDGSTDATAAIASGYGVRVLAHGVNRGLGAGRNTAVRAAAHPWIAALDSDCVPRPDWLETMARRLEADEALAGVGGMLVEQNRTTLADAWRTRHMRQHWGERPLANPAFLFGNNTLFRREALLRVGLYNEKLRTNFEDVAISEALRQAGYALAYEPRAVVHHLRRDTLGSLLRANWRWRFFGYREDIGIRGLAHSLARERVRELARFLWHDARAADLRQGLLSVVAVGYAVASDVRYVAGHYGERRFHDPADVRPAAPDGAPPR
jgi:GT2 family glycosyltransferase